MEAIFTSDNLLFSLAILVANTIQGLTGFAGSLLAMPPSINLQGLITAKVAVNTFGLISSFLIFIKNYKKIDKKQATIIVIVMLLGQFAGFYLSGAVDSTILVRIYGAFIILITLKDMFYKGSADFNDTVLFIFLILAGIFQGLFVSGGPLLIIYITKKLEDKDAMRGTLGLIWIFMNGTMMISQIMAGQFTEHNIIITLVGIPAVFIGVAIGSKLAQILDKDKFMKVVRVMLIISAATLF